MQLYSAGINILRDQNLEVNPINDTPEESILLEYYSRNGFNFSLTDFDTSFATSATGQPGAPDGTATAVKLTEDTNDVYHTGGKGLGDQNTIGQPWCGAIAVKAGTRTKIFVNSRFSDEGTPTIVDLADGSIFSAGASPVVSVSPLGDGWYWITAKIASYTGTGDDQLRIGLVNGSNQTSYPGNGTGFCLLWNKQDFLNRPIPSSFINSSSNGGGQSNQAPWPSDENNYGTGRYQDSPIQIPFTADPQAMSGLIEFIEKGTSLTPGSGVWSIGNYVLASPSLQIGSGAAGYRIIHNNGGNVTSSLAAFPDIGALVRLRWTLRADGSVQIWQSVNGAAEVAADSSAASSLAVAWSESYSWLNGLGAGNQGFIAYRRSVVLPGADISQADLLAHFT